MNTINIRFKKKLEEIYFIEPNNLGNQLLTSLYKRFTARFKSMPFLVIIPLSVSIVVMLYLLFGFLTIKLTTLLQYGF